MSEVKSKTITYSKKEFIAELTKVWPDLPFLLEHNQTLPRTCEVFAVGAFTRQLKECQATKMLREQLQFFGEDGYFIFRSESK